MDNDRTVRAEGGDKRLITPDETGGFTVLLLPLPGVDGVQALRKLLKLALRRCGLRAKSVTPRGTR